MGLLTFAWSRLQKFGGSKAINPAGLFRSTLWFVVSFLPASNIFFPIGTVIGQHNAKNNTSLALPPSPDPNLDLDPDPSPELTNDHR